MLQFLPRRVSFFYVYFGYNLREDAEAYMHRVPPGADTCVPCTTSEGTAPGWEREFHLFVRLQDEHGEAQITVVIEGNVCLLRYFYEVVTCCSFAWYEQTRLLKGLTPDGVYRSPEIVRKRLADYIGNIEAVEIGKSQGRTIAAKVPVREFTIKSWYTEVDEEQDKRLIAYGLE